MKKFVARVEAVSKFYGKGAALVKALDRVTLDLAQGEFTVLAGPSGSGKTTLLNQVGCLDRPDRGKVYVEDQEVSSMGIGARASLRLTRLGFVFQAYNLLPVLTAQENAEFLLELQGVNEAVRKRKVAPLFRELGLKGMERRRPGELSGGQQQRVAVARALAHDPALVLADEPTANLDTASGDRLISLMLKLNKRRGVTFLLSSHDPQLIKKARRVVRMKDGRILRG